MHACMHPQAHPLMLNSCLVLETGSAFAETDAPDLLGSVVEVGLLQQTFLQLWQDTLYAGHQM